MIYTTIKTDGFRIIKFFGLPVYSLQILKNTKRKIFLGGLVSRERVIDGCNESKTNKLLGLTFYKTAKDKDFVKIYLFGILIKTTNIKRAVYDALAKDIRDYDDIYIIDCNLGEAFCILFYFSRHILKKAGKRRVLFCVTKKSLLDMVKTFSRGINCIYINELKYAAPDFSFNINGKTFYMFPSEYFIKVENNVRANKKSHYFTELLNLFGIKEREIAPQKIILSGEVRKSALSKLKKRGIDAGNFVFLSRGANSCELLPLNFWEEVRVELKQKGYEVLENRDALFSLPEVFALGKKAKTIIALRSGLLDILTQTKTPVRVIYTSFKQRGVFTELPSSKVLTGFSLKKLPHIAGGKITEYDANKFTPEELLKTLCLTDRKNGIFKNPGKK